MRVEDLQGREKLDYNIQIDKSIKVANSHSKIYESNLIQYDVKPIDEPKKQKYVKKKNHIRTIRNTLLVISATLAVIFGTDLDDKIVRHYYLFKANNYARNNIESILDETGVGYIKEGRNKITLPSDKEKLGQIADHLSEKGFDTNEEIFYLISQTCGVDAFDKIVTLDNYNDSSDFLHSKHFDEVLDSNGVIVGKKGNYNKFENSVQEDYVKSVFELAEQEKSKGMGM